jgi:hypothetical protein
MIENLINKIEVELKITFSDIFNWFNNEEGLLYYSPINKGWNIKSILEHIYLTNFYLLILIRKGAASALNKSKNTSYEKLLVDYDLDWDKMKAISEHKSFVWNRPEHMEPLGNLTLAVVNEKLLEQMNECISLLHKLKNGEGVLHKTTMTVNGLGKIDVYHYIYFLLQHAKRHLTQMKKVKKEFEQQK